MAMRNRTIIVSLVVVAATLLECDGASAQVKIDMPPPPAKQVQTAPAPMDGAPAATITTSASPATVVASAVAYPVSVQDTPDVGDVALYRYASVRHGTYDTYFNDGSYYNNGIRYITYPNYYPQFVWGPFWGGFWPGFSCGGSWSSGHCR